MSSVVKDEEEGMMGTAVEAHTKICVPHGNRTEASLIVLVELDIMWKFD